MPTLATCLSFAMTVSLMLNLSRIVAGGELLGGRLRG
jgi:hypothetical protein